MNFFMKTFIDEKDQGPLIITHIYLLFSFSIPLWLTMNNSKNLNLLSFSGLLIIGIGDSIVKNIHFYKNLLFFNKGIYYWKIIWFS